MSWVSFPSGLAPDRSTLLPMTQHVAKYNDRKGKARTVKFDLEPMPTHGEASVPTHYMVHCAGLEGFEVVFPNHLQTARAHIATVMEAMDW